MPLPDGAQDLPDGFGYDNGGPLALQSHLQADHPLSYLQLSDLRTETTSKRKRESVTSSCSRATPPNVQSNRDAARLHVAPSFEQSYFEVDGLRTSQEGLCMDCVVDCTDADCQLVNEVNKCTDKCIVVPCDEPDMCHNVCTEALCTLENCDGGEQCFGALDESLQLLCCTDHHDSNANSSQIDWNRTLDDILGVNYGFSNECHQPPLSSAQVSLSDVHSRPADFSAVAQETITRTSSTLAPGPSETQTVFPATAYQSTASQNQRNTPSTSDSTFPCRWHGCSMSFKSLNELVGHVNLAHLRPPSPTLLQPSKKLRLDHDIGKDVTTVAPYEGLNLSCHWDDCTLYPDVSMIPGPSTGLQPETAFDLLSNHLFHDHLGLALPASQLSQFQLPSVFQAAEGDSNPSMPVENTDLNTSLNRETNVSPDDRIQQAMSSGSTMRKKTDSRNSSSNSGRVQKPSYATPALSPPSSASSPAGSNSTSNPDQQRHDCSTSSHTCLWSSCNLTFPDCIALTEHLAKAHVGSGKGHYDCHWGSCTRHGKQGFTSKQKIMRHLQAHTGHRPFMCKECGQHFSEAATLVQHMRRHTQEKPFVCDFPGCGKAFAITGALTIHKRTHNGEKPFRCPHCDRAFAESSNLSKHLRTHTGDRPYRCSEPGCGKAFARPDQLQRHGNVHTKKRLSTSPVNGARTETIGSPKIVANTMKETVGKAEAPLTSTSVLANAGETIVATAN